jgi:PIN domain nuclease of toxin-antitoxin system
MRLLLDTHIFLWFITDDPKLDPSHLRAIDDPENTVYLSVAAYWECLVKYRLGKLPLPPSPETALPALRQQHNIATLDIDEKSVSRLANLPLIHKDPFDRIMVCQALEHALTLVTVDEIVSTYPVPLLPITE